MHCYMYSMVIFYFFHTFLYFAHAVADNLKYAMPFQYVYK